MSSRNPDTEFNLKAYIQGTRKKVEDELDKELEERRGWMIRTTELMIAHYDATARLPRDDSRQAAAEKLQAKYELELANIEWELMLADCRIKVLKDGLEEDDKNEARIRKNQKEKTPVLLQDSKSVHPDECNIIHRTLVDVFGLKFIPVDLETMEIDYNRIYIAPRTGAPVFMLNLQRIPKDEIHLRILEEIVNFLKDFEMFYTKELTEAVFEKLAWRYMSIALRPAQLDTMYCGFIERLEYKERSWEKVQECLARMLQIDSIKLQVVQQLFSLERGQGEWVSSFIARFWGFFDVLDRAGETKNLRLHIVRKITALFTDAGNDMIVSEFGPLDQIDDIAGLLRYASDIPPMLAHDPQYDPFKWLIDKFSQSDDDDDEPLESTMGRSERPHHVMSRGRGKGRGAQRRGRPHRRGPYHQV